MSLLAAARVFTWMGLDAAAAYVGVSEEQMSLAVERRELPAVTTHPLAPGEWMLRSTDLDLWSLWALGRSTPAAGLAEITGFGS